LTFLVLEALTDSDEIVGGGGDIQSLIENSVDPDASLGNTVDFLADADEGITINGGIAG
jgi:hypothetical protein